MQLIRTTHRALGLLLLLLALTASAITKAAAQSVPAPQTQAALACAYNTTPPTIPPGNFALVQCDSQGNIIISNLDPAPIANDTQNYPIFNSAQIAATTTAPAQNTAVCAPFWWQWASHVDKATIYIATTGTGPINFALYSDAIDTTTGVHQPQTLLTNPSLTLSVTSAGQSSVTLGTAGVGISLPHGITWECINDTNASDAVRFEGLNGSFNYVASLIGAANAGFATSTAQLTSLTFSVNAGTTTANWPSFVGQTMTPVNTNPVPAAALQIASAP